MHFGSSPPWGHISRFRQVSKGPLWTQSWFSNEPQRSLALGRICQAPVAWLGTEARGGEADRPCHWHWSDHHSGFTTYSTKNPLNPHEKGLQAHPHTVTLHPQLVPGPHLIEPCYGMPGSEANQKKNKNNEPKLAKEIVISSLIWLAVCSASGVSPHRAGGSTGALGAGVLSVLLTSPLNPLPCKAPARGSKVASCSSIRGDKAGDGTVPAGLSEPRAGLPSWQQEPSLSSLHAAFSLGQAERIWEPGKPPRLWGALSSRGPLTGTIFATENCVLMVTIDSNVVL